MDSLLAQFLALLCLRLLDSAACTPSRSSQHSMDSRGGSVAVAQPLQANPLQSFAKTLLEARRHLLAAAAARGTSIFAMYPVDTIKTRIQMEQRNTFRLAGLFGGALGSIVGQVPYGVLTFGSYEVYKKALLRRFPKVKPVFLYALSAVLGDLTGSGWLCPSEVVKQQMQAGMYKTMPDAIGGIMRKKGIIGFYEGYFGGVARDVPFRIAQLTTYELTKSLYVRTKASRDRSEQSTSLDLTSMEAAFCGAVAGSLAAAVTSPLDRVKTLLMTDSAAYGGSVLSCVVQIWKRDGGRGFFQGLVPRVVYIAPSVAIFFIVYEGVQQRFRHWK